MTLFMALGCMAASVYVPHRRARFAYVPSPLEVANMIAWYDASKEVAAIGTAIDTWEDQGPNGYDLISPIGFQPYVTNNAGQIGGKRWLYFDGASDYLRHGASTVYAQPNTWFLVYNCHGGATAYFLYDSTNAATRNVSWDSSGTQIAMNAGSSVVAPALSKLANKWYYSEDTYNGASSNIKTNEVTYISGNAGAQSLSGLNVGRQLSGTPYYFKGGIAEIIIYNADVSAADRAKLRTYFKHKYGPYASW